MRVAVACAVGAAIFAIAPAAFADSDDYVLPHPDARWWLSAQGNFIWQLQPGFDSPYEGAHSFLPDDHRALSYVATIYGSYRLSHLTAIVLAGESAGGSGLSEALGIAGFTNLDVVRNPSLGAVPYVAHAFVDQIIPLSDHWVTVDRDPLHPFPALPDHRIEIRAGKMSTVDWFDLNEGATDSHKQFMNWSVDNNGAYDYAADTRGYTLGLEAEYDAPQFAVRLGELLMPTVANGIDYDYGIGHARGEQVEGEWHECIAGHPGKLRLLAFANHADMGTYSVAIAEYNELIVTTPDITQTRKPGTLKYGFGLNDEQEVIAGVHVFGRIGWNDGKTESFVYTEIDNTVMVGGDLVGDRWKRPGDKLGLAGVTNGLSRDHATYLADGGLGFILGDGKLRYGREDILEAYYTARAYKGIFPAIDVQAIAHPGFNTDRGPVFVGSIRLHVEL
ncbi:MAG TPA: carbohydrate porin [Kofleriaceae bacterium]